MSEPTILPPVSPGVILLRPDRFFTRRVSLAPGNTAGQVELALENLSPFPLEQLYHGHVVSRAGDEALVFAAHRKQFSTDETAGWAAAKIVLPAFVALQADAPAKPLIRVWHGAQAVTAAAWDGRSPMPAAVLVRAASEGESATALIAELRTRTGLSDAPVEEISGEATGEPAADGKGFVFTIAGSGGTHSASLDSLGAASADVREKGFLAERQRTGKRDLLMWRGFFAALVGLAALVVIELGLFGAGFGVRRLEAGTRQRAAGVEKIATAQSLSQRIEELSQRRLMPFEMLAVLNRTRPASVTFLRVTSSGQRALEVEAQTTNAPDAGAYESVLRQVSELSAVETRDLRAREGVTSFTLLATFKPEAPLADVTR